MIAERDYVIAAVGDNITLSCTAYSKRSENIFWRIGAKNITDNAEKMDTPSLYVSKSVLKYTNLNAEDSENNIECWFLPEEGGEKTTKITLAVLGESFKIVANCSCTLNALMQP